MGQGETDYTYGADDQVVLDAEDRSKNGATRLDGYELTIRPDGSWPGLTAGSGEIRFDRAAMKDIADWLRRKQEELARVPSDLETGALTANFGPSSWVQAANLQAGSALVARTVRSYGDLVMQNLAAAAAAIEGSANDLEKAEQEAAAAARAVNNKIDNGA